MISREIIPNILHSLRPGFINLIYGPRRIGKTVLLSQLKIALNREVLSFNGDTQETRDLLSTTSETQISQIVKDHQVIFIDEAQRIKNITLFLKILIDKFPQKQVFVTGSNCLALAAGARETLTGRTLTFHLYPLSFNELTTGMNQTAKPYLLENVLSYGGYPYLTNLSLPSEKEKYLKTLIEEYLFRDILLGERLVSQDILMKLSKFLAFQLGQEVSVNELSNKLSIDARAVVHYLNLLKESFVLVELGAYATNLRTEIARAKKYYFYDLGLRNALIGQFSNFEFRNDKGALWENFLILERMKKNQNQGKVCDYYFWRNYDQAEVDFIEKQGGKIAAFEFKWKKEKSRTPKAFFTTYNTQASLVSSENFLEFLC